MVCLTDPDGRMIHRYERMAPVYDQLHRRWLRFAGGEAQAALEAAVRIAMTPEAELLDVGCGTGRFARGLLADGVKPNQITLLDRSNAMLSSCTDIPVRRMQGRLEALPFADSSFDIVTSAWAVETLSRPQDGLRELCRVLRPGGALCLTFCAERSARGIADWLMRLGLSLRQTGRFLDAEDIKSSLEAMMVCAVQIMPSTGPAATVIARRSEVRTRNRTPACDL